MRRWDPDEIEMKVTKWGVAICLAVAVVCLVVMIAAQ